MLAYQLLVAEPLEALDIRRRMNAAAAADGSGGIMGPAVRRWRARR
jgi:hypothetical protein